MPTITFRVNLEAVNNLSDKQPYNQSEGTNFKETRNTWFPDILLNNRKLKHDAEFTLSGENAMYLKNNFTSGVFKFLDIVSETSP